MPRLGPVCLACVWSGAINAYRRPRPAVVLAILLLGGLLSSPAGAVASPTPATTLQFYGGEVRAVAQIGNLIYVGGSFTSVGYGSGTIARSHLVALDATTGLHVPGFDPRADDDVNALLRSPDGTRLPDHRRR